MAATFHILDYVVFAVVLLISLGIGVFFSFRQKSTSEYFMGGRQLTFLPVTISIAATITSAHSLLGTPAEIYVNGTQYFLHIFGAFLGVVLGGYLFVPLFHPLELTSVFEYLECRYKSWNLRRMLNLITMISSIVVNAAGVYGPSVSMHTMTGLPTWVFILIFGAVTTIYTSIGGMKAVILADVFQAVFIYAGVITVCILGLVKVGGIGTAINLHTKWERLTFFNMNPDPTDPTTFWSTTIGYGTLTFCLCHIQPCMQRYCGLPKLTTAKRSMYFTAGLLLFGHFFFALSGFAAFAYYASISCDPLRAKTLHSPNQILPYFVMEVLTVPGLPGLFVACVTSTALSTSSSLLNSLAAVIWEDYMSIRYKHWSDKSKATTSKVIVFIFGIIGVVLAYIIMNIKGTLVMFCIAIAGGLIGPTAGIFVLGAINPKANAKAAAVGYSASLSLFLILCIGALVTKTSHGLAPSPISGCEVRNLTMAEGATVSSLMMDLDNKDPLYTYNASHKMLDHMNEDSHQVTQFKRKPKSKFVAVSALWFPLIGLSTTVIVASLLSLIPYFANDYHVEDKYLFEFVRKIRNRKSGKEKEYVKCQVKQLDETISNGAPLADKANV